METDKDGAKTKQREKCVGEGTVKWERMQKNLEVCMNLAAEILSGEEELMSE